MIRRRFQFQGPEDPEPDAQVRTEPAAPNAPTARPQPAPRPNQPVRNTPTPTKAPQSKEADLSHRPESIQSVPRPGSDQTVTVIGNGARLEGNLIAAASLRIEGTVTGTITADGDVIIAFANEAVTGVDDLLPGHNLPSTDGLIFHCGDEVRVTVRPSGTEPKLKVYFEVVEPVSDGDVASARARAADKLAALRTAVGSAIAVPTA